MLTSELIARDKSHRSLALDATQSFIVQAPAGSGKTELLIQRFLTLLTIVKSPEEILAITFTKKAASEMRARVIKALKQAAVEHEPASPHAKQTWQLAKKVLQRDAEHQWHIMQNPNQLRIQTIDSLCAYLTKQLPLLSHFGSQPDIAINPTVLYRAAVQEVLTHVEENFDWSEAITRLLLHLDNDLNKLHDLLVNLLAKRDQWLLYISLTANEAEIKKHLEHQLELVICDALQSLQALFPAEKINELMHIVRFAAANIKTAGMESEILACMDLETLPGTAAKDKNAWLGIAKILLTKSFTWRKQADESIGFSTLKNLKNPAEKALHQSFRQAHKYLIETLNEKTDLRLSLEELFYLPEYKFNESQWSILQALLYLLKVVAAQLRVTFQQHRQIDFIENTQAALAALGSEENPTDLALALDYQIKHILVDEFQDTSSTQYHLLEKLTAGWEDNDGRTLFVVGDPMQSIYRFREAEVGLFMRMFHSGIGHINFTPLTLAVNFRSTESIVNWNNQHFQTIFPSFNDVATGAVSYSHSASNQNQSNDTTASRIHIRGFVDAHEESQAAHIIDCINETKKNHPQDKIAILVRSRSHLKAIIPALKQAKLAYRAIAIDPLASRQNIQDLLSLTCALLHPADRIAWLAVLRAPWCGLSLHDLFIITGNDPHANIYEQLQRQDIIEQLSQSGQQHLNRVFTILKNKIAERERYDLRSWVEGTWLLLGGPAYFRDMLEIDDAHAYFKLLEQINQQNQVLNLDRLKENINQLYAASQHDDATIQIMTIHTAKGLEFDTVILPQLDRKNPNDDKSLLSWIERPLTNDHVALLIAPINATGTDKDKIYEYINRQQRLKSDYETDRLFYVAATRAKKRLFLFFDVDSKEDGSYKIESGSFLDKIWPQLQSQQHDILKNQVTHIPNMTTTANDQRHIMRIQTAWQNPITEMMKNEVVAHKKRDGFVLPDNTPRWQGTVIHKILQNLSIKGIDWWQKQATSTTTQYLARQLRQLGIHAGQLKPAIESIQHTIERVLADERGRWILQPHQNAQSEFALTAVIDNKPESIVVDRTFIDDNGVRWIIDYKTTMPVKVSLEEFKKAEQKKYSEQMQKYSSAFKLLDDKPIMLGLYFPAIPAWQEWEFTHQQICR